MDATCSAPSTRPDLSSSMGKANNVDWQFTTQSYLLNRAPEYFIYLYNVSKQDHTVSRPPVMREMKINGRKDNERVAFVTRLPQPLLTPKGNVDSNEIAIDAMDTRRFVMDIINPDNLGINQDALIEHVTGQGNDLGAKGVFWSLNNPPTEEEIKAAYARLEKRYKYLLDQARTVETSNPKMLSDILSPEHFQAAEYFHTETNWHTKVMHKDNCPRCGTPATVGAPFHPLEGGGVCIDGIKGWEKAVAAGVRSRSQAYEATGEEQFAPRVPKVQAPVAPKPTIPTEQK